MTLRLALAAALLAPVAAVSLGAMAIAASERAGAAPFAGIIPANSAEAAGLGRAADLLRFLRAGEDPRHAYAVRPEVLSSAIRRATTLEAAMWSRQVELVRLLEREGAIADDRDRRELACLAADLRADDIVAYLAPDGAQTCEPGAALARVTARTGGDHR